MSLENAWTKKFLDSWLEKAKDYPTKALITIAVKELYPQQKLRLEAQHALIDGSAWSPDSWND